MKNIFFPVFCVLLFMVLAAGCGNGSTNGPPVDLPNGYQNFTYQEWSDWTDSVTLSPAEQSALLEYMQNHLSELSPDGKQFWMEMLAYMRGTDKVPVESGSTIAGISFSVKDTTHNNNYTHYKLEEPYFSALDTLKNFFEMSPGPNYMLREGSDISSDNDWVILEITDHDYRLIQRSGGGTQSGVAWRKAQ